MFFRSAYLIKINNYFIIIFKSELVIITSFKPFSRVMAVVLPASTVLLR